MQRSKRLSHSVEVAVTLVIVPTKFVNRPMAENEDVVQQFQFGFQAFCDGQRPVAARKLGSSSRAVGQSQKAGSSHPRLLLQHVPRPAPSFLALPLLACRSY